MNDNSLEPKFGFNKFAEIWNGRLAMIGFVAILVEIFTGKGLLAWTGLL